MKEAFDYVVFDYRGRTYGFEHPEGDHIGRQQAARSGFYELALLEAIGEKLRVVPEADRTGIAVDVGAHVGNHSVYFSEVLGLRTIAFEPNPDVFPILARNVEANAQKRVPVAMPIAVGRSWGWSTIQPYPEGNTGMAKLDYVTSKMRLEPRDVRVIPLDSAVWDTTGALFVDVLKIDAEGHEEEILAGQCGVLHGTHIVTCEAHTEAQRDNLDSKLSRYGYARDPRVFCKTPTYLWTLR